MPDFSEIAARAKADHDARVAEDARAAAERRSAHKAICEAGANVLRGEVMPMLDEAAAEFLKLGVVMHIEEKLDVGYHPLFEELPAIAAHCIGPAKMRDSHQRDTTEVFVQSDGKSITVGHRGSKPAYGGDTTLGTANVGESGSLIAAAMQFLIEEYYRVLRRG